MKAVLKVKQFVIALILIIIYGFGSVVHAQDSNIKNVVLVHGAFAPRSGWQQVYSILKKNGYKTTIVQIPLTSLKEDVAAVKQALDKLDTKAVLVGHSWSGTVITEAGMHPNVAALVYISAFQPDVGETTLQWVQFEPSAPESGLLPPDEKGFVYYDKDKFHLGFSADLSKEQSEFMADAQQPIAASCFTDKISQAAWHYKPCYGIVGTADKSINPIILRSMYKRSLTKLTEIEGASDAVFISHPREVVKVIVSASK